MGVMGILNKKAEDHRSALDVIRERTLQLRQLHRALERIGFEKLAEEIESISDDLLDEHKIALQAMDTVIAEIVAEGKRDEEPVDVKEKEEEGEGGAPEVAEVGEATAARFGA